MNEFERISQSAVYSWCRRDRWVIGVHVCGTAGNLARYGRAYTDGEKIWGFAETDYEDAVSVGQW